MTSSLKLQATELTQSLTERTLKPDELQYCASRGIELPVATADTGKLATAAAQALAMLWRPGYRYKKAGVMFVDLVKAAGVQGGLFDAPDTPNRQRPMQTMDGLNARYGRETVTFAASGINRAWKLRREFISPRYTINVDELLRA